MTRPPRPVPRFLADDGERDPARGLALDEALVRTPAPQTTLRLWRTARCVVVGRAQLADAEVDAAACRVLGVPVYRRFSGGGAIYQDPGTLDVTLVVRRDDPLLAASPELARIPGLYRLVTEPLVAAVRAFGLPAAATERAVLLDGSKISGVAGWLGREAILVHATLLVDADLATLERVLAGPGAPGDPRWERTKSRRVPVTSLAEALGGVAQGSSDVDAAVAAAFADRLSPLEPGAVDQGEAATIERLMEERYGRSKWHTAGDIATGDIAA